MLSLLATSTPTAPQTIVALAKQSRVSFAFWFNASGWRKAAARLLESPGSKDKGQEKQRDRDAKVSRIQIYPGDVTVDLSDHVSFSAIGYDRDGAPVGGVKVKWSGQSSVAGQKIRISPHGKFEATTAGSFNIVAEGAGKSAAVTVVVRPSLRRILNLAPTGVRQVSTRDLPPAVATKANSSSESIAQHSRKTTSKTKPRGSVLRAHPRASKSSAVESPSANAAAVPLLPGDGWGDSNYLSADDPGNSVGNPPGGAMDEGAGSGNFQIAAPVLGLPGRGIDISLGLAYNSRLWNKAGSEISFDNDRGWPAPGWSLGFGKILGMGVLNGGMIVDADGTRHGYSGTVTEIPWGTTFVGHTTDGTFIDYSYTSGTGGGIVSAQAKLPNGTIITYGAPGPGAVYPTSIEDPNGNYITITYVNNAGPRIQSIADTLNRPINFHYDSNNFLTAITGPGLNNTERTLVRLNYRQISLNYSFSGLTPGVRDPQPWVINAIYYPGTNTGYWFGESNSYSTYGMLARVSERRNMSFSAASLTEQGTITSAGDITREEVYNYPLTTSDPGGSGLTDAPTYTSLTETWTRDGVNTDQAVTNYLSQPNASPRTVTITLPNGTKSIQYSHNAPGSFLDGLVFQDQTLDSANTVLQSSSVTWQQGAYESPRPMRVEATNELLQMTATELSYGAAYNQVTEVRNYDYGGVLPVRVTRTQYQNSANYTGQQTTWGYVGRHIFNLPLAVEVFAGDGATRVSRTDYQYDGQTLTARPDVVHHGLAFNPHAAAEGYCYWDSDWSDPDCNPPCSPDLMGCDNFCPQIYYCPYDPATDSRGNVTQITTYANASTEPSTIPTVETRRYDIAGNMVTASTSCCEQTSVNYTVDTQYAYPLSQTRGSATDPYAQVTTSATYDFNTGLVLSATDANGRTSSTTYHAATLRPITSTSPTDAHTDYAYDDAAMTVTSTTYAGPGLSAIADQNVKLLNGRGQVRQEQARAADDGPNQVWDLADAIYNNLGQVSQQSRPYRSGQTPQLSTATYDALGRTTRVTAPDGSVTETYYNERDFDPNDSYVPQRPTVASTAAGETTLVRDAWGRERWGRTDAQGRLVEVVEPNPSGSGSVSEAGALVTSYTYNTLGNLIQVGQGAQTRSFNYDSFGRLIAQKLAETSATLNDAGAYQAGGSTWSDVFTYDDRSNLTSRTDSRGVKTVYNFNNDPLNRLQSVSWDINGFGDTANPILPAATVSYAYRTKNSPTHLRDVTQLSSVTSAGVSTESYDYDSEGRTNFKSLVVNGRPPMETNYAYDALDRIQDVTYPKRELGVPLSPRKVVHHEYDLASRLTSLTVDGAIHASNIVYNAASQTTSLSVGAGGANQIIESYNYDQQTGLLASQTVARFSSQGTPILNLGYDYAGVNGKRTGQLTKILNNLNHNKDRGYTYDALGRLTSAQGGPSTGPLWTQNYSYDRYGNRTNVSANGFSAKAGSRDAGSAGILPAMSAKREAGASESEAVATGKSDPQVVPPTEQLVARTDNELSDSPRSTSVTNSHHTSRTAGSVPSGSRYALIAGKMPALPARTNTATPQGGPPVFTDDPLVPGVTAIKAVHITELRTAVNQARSHASLPAANWAESVSQGVTLIKAAHIVELRARLDEARGALGMSAASYTDPTLTVDVSTVKAVHIQELRQRVAEALTVIPGCPAGQNLATDQFVKNFYQGALNRQPNAAELQTWSDQLRQAYWQGQSQQLATAQYMGRQLFKSQEYLNRNRTNSEYVYDLYKGYLQREPDQAGWDFWTAGVQANGRDAVLEAFAVCEEFANKVASLCPGGSTGSSPIPLDGIANLSYDAATNRITTSGFTYDAAGNQTRKVRTDGSGQRFQYDAANRLVKVTDDYAHTLANYTYADSNERLIAEESGLRTYYACDGSVEYVETGSSTTPQWSKTYIYLGARLLSTLTPNGSGGDFVQYHHPDRLGTRLVTNAQDTNSFEQVTLPFGTALTAESTGATNRRFTAYDRSVTTGLDYAVNRHYDSQQGRFTQVDPIGMKSVKLIDPQTLNLYAYCTNDPINHTDPDGLGFLNFFKKLFKGIGKVLSAVGNAIAKILNNKWVRIGFFIASFIIPFVGPALAKILSTAVKIYNAIADIGAQLQLYGQLLQGKFKELGISVGLGIVGSYIAMVEDAVVSGIQTSLLRGTNVLRGAIQGFKEGFSRLSANLIGRSLKNMFIPAYGIYGGPGNPPDDAYNSATGEFDPDVPGVDDIDNNGFKNHDLAYRDPLKNRRTLRNADVRLVRTLLGNAPRVRIIDIAFGGRPGSGSVFKFFALNYFTGSAAVRSARL